MVKKPKTQASRTTVRMKESLLREAQAAAARNHVSFTRFLEDAVRVALKAQGAMKTARATVPRLATFSSALMPGVDLNDSANLLTRMGDDAAL